MKWATSKSKRHNHPQATGPLGPLKTPKPIHVTRTHIHAHAHTHNTPIYFFLCGDLKKKWAKWATLCRRIRKSVFYGWPTSLFKVGHKWAKWATYESFAKIQTGIPIFPPFGSHQRSFLGVAPSHHHKPIGIHPRNPLKSLNAASLCHDLWSARVQEPVFRRSGVLGERECKEISDAMTERRPKGDRKGRRASPPPSIFLLGVFYTLRSPRGRTSGKGCTPRPPPLCPCRPTTTIRNMPNIYRCAYREGRSMHVLAIHQA